MSDDEGFANASTFGGPVHTPTLDRLANSGISYNAFHRIDRVYHLRMGKEGSSEKLSNINADEY